MKTAQQIKQYLEKQEWFPRFLKNLENPIAERESSLNGLLGELTICFAFNWGDTKEGWSYWQTINERFQEWWCGNNPSESPIDWDQKRYELARDLFLQSTRSSWGTADVDLFMSVKYANMLIDEIKKG